MNIKFLIRFAGIVLLAGNVMADTMSWTNAAGGNWADTGNWDTTVPGADDVAEFNLDSAAAYTVNNVTDGTTNQLLMVAQDKVKLDLTGTTYTLTNLLGIIVGPENTTGELEIVGGTVQFGKQIYVGYKTHNEDPVQDGTLILDGTTISNADNDGDSVAIFRVGNKTDGNGTVIVRGGSKINQNWGIRNLTMPNSRNGGLSRKFIIADSGTEVGIAQMEIGNYSPDDISISTLVVTNGAELKNTGAYNSYIGNAGPGTLIVTGAGSLAQLTGQVNPLYIGNNASAGGRGIIQVLDGGTFWDGYIPGTETSNDHDTYYGTGGSSHGSLLVEGADSHYRVDHHPSHSTYFRTNSTLVVRNGGKVSTYRGSELVFEQGSSLGGDGRLEIDVNCSGIIKPGGTLVVSNWYGVTSAPGTLTVTSNLTMNATALYDVELAGSYSSDYDRVVASNDVVLAGSIAVSMIDGFTYSTAVGYSYTVMEVGGTLSGTFSNAANGEWIETANPGESFQIHYGPSSKYAANSVVLTTKPLGTVILIQ